MARDFNGTSDLMDATFTFTSLVLTYAVMGGWFWRDTNTANQIIFEYGQTVGTGFDVIQAAFAGPSDLIRSFGGGGLSWADSYPSPSTGTWHQMLWGITIGHIGFAVNNVWIDGVQQTLTNQGHSAFGSVNETDVLTVGGRLTSGVPSRWWAGRACEVGLWTPGAGAVFPSTQHALALAAGVPPPFVYDEGLVGYWPLLGDPSPEPNYTAGQESMTLSGTTVVNHPGVRALLLGAR